MADGIMYNMSNGNNHPPANGSPNHAAPQTHFQQAQPFVTSLPMATEHYVSVVPMNQPHMVMMNNGSQVRAH
jgi:hypothetical protein